MESRGIVQKVSVLGLALLMGMLLYSDLWAADIKEANSLYRKAERSFFSGKTDEADETLKQVEAIVEEAKMDDPSSVGTIEGKVGNLRKRIDQKLGRGQQSGSSSTSKPAQPAGAGASGELPPGVTSRITMIKRYLDSGFPSLEKARQNISEFDEGKFDYDSGIRGAERALASANSKLQEMEDRYGDKYSPDHPDVVAVKESMAELQKGIEDVQAKRAEGEAAMAQGAADAGAASVEWIVKLKPYITSSSSPEYDENKYFIASYTEETEEMVKRQNIYLMARKDFNAYKESGVSDKATDELQDIARKLEMELTNFEENCESMANFRLDEAERQIDRLLERAAEEAKKIGTGDMPLPASKFALQQPLHPLGLGKLVLGEDHERVVELEKKYAQLLAEDAKLVQARVSENRMLPDKYSGDDASALKAKAEEILKTKYGDAKVLRTTLISDDWKEENVLEWTDTTRTAWRHRITRYLSAQTAGKIGKETKVYTIYLGKDRRSDGSWGSLKGHVMFEDLILEENVQK